MPKTPEEGRTNPLTDPNIKRWFKDSRVLWEGATFEQKCDNMDEAGIEMGILTASPEGSGRTTWSVGSNISDEAFEAACQRFVEAREVSKGRLRGCIGIDPTGMMRAVRQVERAVRDY